MKYHDYWFWNHCSHCHRILSDHLGSVGYIANLLWCHFIILVFFICLQWKLKQKLVWGTLFFIRTSNFWDKAELGLNIFIFLGELSLKTFLRFLSNVMWYLRHDRRNEMEKEVTKITGILSVLLHVSRLNNDSIILTRYLNLS